VRYVPENPLIVQSDHTLLLETMGPHFRAARDSLARFAELVKSPDYVHTYRVTPLSLWNAASAGMTVEEVVQALEQYAKYDVPPNVPVNIRETMGRYGRLKLYKDPRGLRLEAEDPILMTEVCSLKPVIPLLGTRLGDKAVLVEPGNRGELKQALTHAGHPVEDLAGYRDGEHLDFVMAPEMKNGAHWGLRDYQRLAVEAFHGDGLAQGGSGVVVLPCGAGKTMVGIGAMARLNMKTLILCTNVTALRQWRNEILDKTTLTEDLVGEYSGELKDIRPVTLTTYQMLTFRKSKNETFVHFGIFDRENWGLIVYDEVHLLPAPIFRAVAHLQARRRLGLPPRWYARTARRPTSSRSSARNGSTSRGRTSSTRGGSPPPPARRSASPSPRRTGSGTRWPTTARSSESPVSTPARVRSSSPSSAVTRTTAC
jgi:DNA excision repair protein ERCC-3